MIKRSVISLMACAAILTVSLITAMPVHAADCLSKANAVGCKYGLPAEQYVALEKVMAANPTPPGERLAPDPAELLRYSDTKEKRYASKFTGVLVPGTPALQAGWILRNTRPVTTPGGLPEGERITLARYQRVYIYATQRFDGQEWALVGPGQWVRRSIIAKLIAPSRPAGVSGQWIAVDTTQQVLTAWQDDKLLFATLVSTGKAPRITRNGLTHIYLRQEKGDMSRLMADRPEDNYNIYNVAWVMYFNGGMALHAATWHDNFGQVMSHGCVNLSITDARWVFNWTRTTPDATVYVWRSK